MRRRRGETATGQPERDRDRERQDGVGPAAAGGHGEPGDVHEGDQRRGEGAPHGAAPQGPELDGAEEAEEHVGQESRRADQQPPGKPERELAADVRIRVDPGGGAERGGRDACPVHEGAAAAGDHVEGLADHAPLVVVQVAAQVQHAVRLEREVTRGQHALSCRIPLSEGEGRIGREEHQPVRGPLRPALDEERPLPEVEAPELAIDAPQLEAGSERQGPV